MGRIAPVVAGVLIVIGAWWVWGWLFPSDEALIHRTLDRIAASVGNEDGDGNLARLGRVATLREEFHPELFVDAGPPFRELRGREAVIGAVARTGTLLQDLEVSFTDVVIAVEPSRQAASVTLVAEARFRAGEAGGPAYEARELDVRFVRHEGRWVVSEVLLVGGLAPLR